MAAPVAVVETSEFLAVARKLMREDERAALVDYLAGNPLSGDLIAGTGGVRKLRWALEGRGKRGGARVIYFFHSEKLPLFIFTMYAKNVQSDLSDADRNELRLITKSIAESYGKAGR
jgi:hypothetical protein